MKKLLSMMLAAVLSVSLLAGCGAAPSEAESEAPAQTGPELTMSWVGSHSTSNAMGDVVSGHLINFYSDSTVKIYYGIKAGIQGHHYGSYTGTYTEDGTVKYSYYRESEDAYLDGEFKADLSADSFQAKVFCMASFPNSGAGGIHYVRIDPVEPDPEAEYVYCGSSVKEEGTYGAYMQLRDGELTGSAAADGVTGSFNGTWSIAYSGVTDIDTPDRLTFLYAPLTAGESAITAEGEAVESGVDFNDPSFITYQLVSGDDVFPRIPMAAIVNQDGSHNSK